MCFENILTRHSNGDISVDVLKGPIGIEKAAYIVNNQQVNPVGSCFVDSLPKQISFGRPSPVSLSSVEIEGIF